MNIIKNSNNPEVQKKDIVLFYYYSAPSLPKECFLNLKDEVAYRNMFLFYLNKKIHFEFPMFEDHSYNSICNTQGVKSLIKHPNKEKYMIFVTTDKKKKKSYIIGYYRVDKAYYQETNMFNSNGYIWGIESLERHLIKKETILYDKKVTRKYLTSWGPNEKYNQYLNNLLNEIKIHKNVSEIYKNETNRLVELFKNKNEVEKWKKACECCEKKSRCTLNRRYKRYAKKNKNSDMFSAINNIYNSNIYSKNELNKIQKKYIFMR